MSRTKARVISSLRMRRWSHRRNKTNCTPAETTAVNMAYQWAGMERSSRVMTLLVGAQHAAPLQRQDDQKNAPGRAPRVEPRPEPSAEKKPPPPLREALLRTLRSSAGMP